MFTLKNITIDLVLKKYGIADLKKKLKPSQITNIPLLVKKPIISFLDSAKNEHQCFFNFVNVNAQSNRYKCFWCRHDIKNGVIGVPVEYNFTEKIKSYHSELNNEIYVIYENVINEEKEKKYIREEDLKNTTFCKKNFYVISDICCSWNCAAALINDNRKNTIYESSKILLCKMYKELHNIPHDVDVDIKPAPHWKMINVHGGPLTIKQFRNKFNKFVHIPKGTMNIDFKFISHLCEEKMTF
jgi:hypothetical protein